MPQLDEEEEQDRENEAMACDGSSSPMATVSSLSIPFLLSLSLFPSLHASYSIDPFPNLHAHLSHTPTMTYILSGRWERGSTKNTTTRKSGVYFTWTLYIYNIYIASHVHLFTICPLFIPNGLLLYLCFSSSFSPSEGPSLANIHASSFQQNSYFSFLILYLANGI